MNKLNTILSAMFISISLGAFAADCSPMSGRYIIGTGEKADFSTFADALTALKCGGVSGPVIFTIESGTYNEKLAINSIPGASAINNIIFEASSDAVISYTAADATVMLNGSSYITFENLTIDHKAASYGNCVKVDG